MLPQIISWITVGQFKAAVTTILVLMLVVIVLASLFEFFQEGL
jgi:hypothetical protein